MPRRKRAKKEARQRHIYLFDPRSSDSSDDNNSVGPEPLTKNSPKNDSGIDADPGPADEPPEADGVGDLASLASTPIPAPKTDKDGRYMGSGRFSLKAWIAAKKELGIPLTGKNKGSPDHARPLFPYDGSKILQNCTNMRPFREPWLRPFTNTIHSRRLSLAIVRPLMRVRMRG